MYVEIYVGSIHTQLKNILLRNTKYVDGCSENREALVKKHRFKAGINVSTFDVNRKKKFTNIEFL